MLQIIVKLIGVVIVLIGVIVIYDARLITKRYFGFGDKNEATRGLKMLGTIISTVGGMLILFIC